jgi:hypothetical protein
MVSAPWWFLDVDGVLNSFPPPAAPVRPRAGSAWTYRSRRVVLEGRVYVVTTADELATRLNDLDRDGSVAVVWCTTWGEGAAASLAPELGLPHWPVAPYPDDVRCAPVPGRSSAPWWKVEAISRWLDRDPRAYVVTDDDLTPEASRDLRTRHPDLPSCLVRPRTSPGLTPDQLDEVEEFLAAHRAAG